MVKEAFKNQYGCRLKGTFFVKEVPGNFHISSHSYQQIYMRLAMDGFINTLDVSHKIHALYFGPYKNVFEIMKAHPGSQLIPLQNHKRIYSMNTPHSYISHYHIDIVPTLYMKWLSSTKTYQYTYNHNSF